MKTSGCVYALLDPRSHAVRYVGMTVQDPRRRLSMHLRDADRYRHHAAAWLMTLKRCGLRPVIKVLGTYPVDELSKREREFIDAHRAAGADLTNTAPGGLGGSRPGRIVTDIHRQRLAEAARRQWADPVLGARMREAQKATAATPEFSRKVSEGKVGRPYLVSRRIKDDLGREYWGIADAARRLGLRESGVGSVLRGAARTTGGRRFSYV